MATTEELLAITRAVYGPLEPSPLPECVEIGIRCALLVRSVGDEIEWAETLPPPRAFWPRVDLDPTPTRYCALPRGRPVGAGYEGHLPPEAIVPRGDLAAPGPPGCPRVRAPYPGARLLVTAPPDGGEPACWSGRDDAGWVTLTSWVLWGWSLWGLELEPTGWTLERLRASTTDAVRIAWAPPDYYTDEAARAALFVRLRENQRLRHLLLARVAQVWAAVPAVGNGFSVEHTMLDALRDYGATLSMSAPQEQP